MDKDALLDEMEKIKKTLSRIEVLLADKTVPKYKKDKLQVHKSSLKNKLVELYMNYTLVF